MAFFLILLLTFFPFYPKKIQLNRKFVRRVQRLLSPEPLTVGCPYDASSHTNYQNKEINIDVLLSSNPQSPSLTNCPNSDTFNYHI